MARDLAGMYAAGRDVGQSRLAFKRSSAVLAVKLRRKRRVHLVRTASRAVFDVTRLTSTPARGRGSRGLHLPEKDAPFRAVGEMCLLLARSSLPARRRRVLCLCVC